MLSDAVNDETDIPRNVLTINVEDYYQVGAFSNLIPPQEWDRFEERIALNVERALMMLRHHGAWATFFVSGWIAERYPDIVRRIVAAGHNVGAQGYYQQTIRDLSPSAFRDDITKSKALVEAATGTTIHGFRIGRHWIGPDAAWALDIIRDAGFSYDSSVCPRGRRDYGALRQRFAVDSISDSLVELPISGLTVAGYTLPVAGGNYLRQLPLWLTQYGMDRWVRGGQPLVAYFHVWELDANQPSITGASQLQRLRHYRNLDQMRERLANMLERFRFVSVEQYLGLPTRPAEQVDSMVPMVGETPPGASPAIESPIGLDLSLAIVVPCYNEEASIAYLARTLEAFVEANPGWTKLRFIFVDDGSSDETWQRLQAAFGPWGNADLLRLPRNQGIAAAVMAGVARARTEFVAVIDADCTFQPDQLVTMLPLMVPGVSVVAASPFMRKGDVKHVPLWRLTLSRGAALLYRLVMRNQLTSYTSCFRIYRRDDLADIEVRDPGFGGITEILAHLDLRGQRIVETHATLQVRLLGESKIRLLNVTLAHLRLLSRVALARLSRRPLDQV